MIYYNLEVADFTRLVNIYAPCTVTLKQTCPLMKILNEYSLKSTDNEMQYELDFSYLEPFATYLMSIHKNTITHVITLCMILQEH